MASTGETKRDARVLFLTWIGLVCLTLGSFWLASSSTAATTSATVGLLGFAAAKGLLIAGVFMEMRHGPLAWAAVMGGFLLAEAALIVAILP